MNIQISWQRAERWLTLGRPLSLIALDALVLCTTTGDLQNQSLWLQQHPPALIDRVEPAMMANRLQEHLSSDKVPRTKNAIERILKNIFPSPVQFG